MKKTSLAIFDFDGTLVRTQMPDEGKIIWKEKTGNDWPHKGWWGRKESLDNEIFDQKPIADVRQEYLREKTDDTLMIMLTGRMPKLSKEVEIILADNDYVFDEYRYNYGGSTINNKLKQINEIMKNNPDLDYISLYDDRLEHIPMFKDLLVKFKKSGRIDRFNIFHVNNRGEVNEIK